MDAFLGVDPGLSGGLALISKDGVIFEPMPCLDGVLDLAALTRWIRAHQPRIRVAFLEAVHAMPKQGVSSSFKFGRVYGNVEGVLAALGVPYVLVSPQRWQKVMHAGIEGQTKQKSLVAVSRLFPNLDLRATPRSRTAHEGIAEALLIAEYGRRLEASGVS